MRIQYAPNPLLGETTFVPDVEAHIWADGRIYLYGSFDLQGKNTYCSDRYHVYSSDDMQHWVDHGVAFTLQDTAWAADCGALYAPDCAYRNGKYYLYYCVPDGRCGVAVSEAPYGPFRDVGPIEHVLGIDPAVLIDDDGCAYLYWGQFDNVRAAKLLDNMTQIDPNTMTQPLSVAEHEFHEGSSVKKINGKYYFLFTDTHRHGGRATCLGYAVSDNPMTGFVYGGIIIDNFGCDPKTWNNHGSMECFQGQWYVFYHRSTHGSEHSRWVCAEPITIGDDGKIRQVRMTTSGAGQPLPAKDETPAWRACGIQGNARLAGEDGGMTLQAIRPGDRVCFRDLLFAGEDRFLAETKADGACRIELYIDDWYQVSLPVAEWDKYTAASVQMSPVTGVHAVTVHFYGDFTDASLRKIGFSEER